MTQPFRVSELAIEGCAICGELKDAEERALREWDRSGEANARVKLRRHLREKHGVNVPWPWGS